MKKIFLSRISQFFNGLAILFLIPFAVTAQNPPADMPAQGVSQEWARRFDNQAKGITDNTIAASDAEGNVYISGISTSNGKNELVTVKFAPNGQELWAVRRNPENFYQGVKAIAVDNSGSVYLTGFETDHLGRQLMITISYNTSTGAENWTRLYSGGEEWTSNEGRAIVADATGGIYVTGFSNSSNTGADFITIRYEAATGAESWISRYNAQGEEWSWDEVKAIALDHSGGVYVAGISFGDFTSADFVTLRYEAATGAQTWVNRYNRDAETSNSGSYDEVSAIVADGAGGVFVTGTTYDFTNYNTDFTTIRYETSSGEMSWVRHYNGSGDRDAANAIATDDTGGVYVTGTSMNFATGYHYATIRYEATTGAESWVSHYDSGSPEWVYEEGRSIATDGQGGVYVTGRVISPSGSPDFGTIRYDAATGTETWSKHYNGGAEEWSWDEASVVLLDPAGGVYAIGPGNGILGSDVGSDFIVVRYHPATGEEIWASRYEGIMASTNDFPISMVADADGNTYVTGTSYASNYFSSVMVTIKYSPEGEELWVSEFKEGIHNTAYAIALDPSGGVFITGVSEPHTGRESLTIRYDAATGEQSWVSRFAGNEEFWTWNEPRAITTDGSGGVYVTGYTSGYTGTFYTTIRYEAASGEETWVNLYSGIEEWNWNGANAIVADEDGGVYVTGSSWISGEYGIATIRYEASTGEMSWVSRYEGGQGVALALDEAGGVFVAGSIVKDGIPGFLTLRYDAATGAESWLEYYHESEDVWGWNEAKAITTDEAGGVIVAGTRHEESGTSFVTLRYEGPDGSRSWVNLYSGEKEGSWNDASAIATDGAGGVYVTGRSSVDYTVFATVKYRILDGTQEWVIQSEGPLDGAVDLALDAQNNVYVTGYSMGNESGMDFLTVKYSQSQCTPSPSLKISGDLAVSVGTGKSVYSGTGTGNFWWSISGDQVVSFSGQGTSEISVDWPDKPGVYKISLSYSNDCTSQTATAYVFVSDSDAGFVTGGGWIHSSKSSEYELMQEEGKAIFFLNAGYKKGGQKIKGHLQLKAPSFRFEANTIEDQTLVIAGTKAYFTGKGSLRLLDENGKENQDPRPLGYLLSVNDETSRSGTGTDHFRLIIWELNSDNSQGQVLFDNQFTCSPAILDHHLQACNPIGKGNITIHKGKENARIASTEELSMPEKFTVYPVPFADQLNLQHEIIKKDVLVLVALIGADGKSLDVSDQIVAQADGYLKINLERLRLTNGLYILRVETAGESPVFQRVIAQQ